MLDTRGIISVVSIILYVLLGLLSFFFFYRNSFATRAPWAFLIMFCTLRIIGDCFQIATEQPSNSTNTQLLTGSAVCNSIGLGPLLLITTRLILQCNACIHCKAVPNQTHRALVTFEFCIMIATILSIVGGVQSFKPSHLSGGILSTTPVLKAGICLYTAAYACIWGSAVVVANRGLKTDTLGQVSQFGFLWTTLCVLLGLIFLVLRVVYSFLVIFGENPDYSPFNGRVVIQVCLQVMPEWVVTMLYVSVAGMMRNSAPPPKEKATEQEEGDQLRAVLRFVPFVHWFIK